MSGLADSCTQREDASEELLLTFWKRATTWLHFMHATVVPISWSPQCNWWGLVLPKTHPAKWVTLHNILGLFFREMLFLLSCAFLLMKGHDLYQLDPVTVSRGKIYNFIVLIHNQVICLKGDLLKWRSLTMKYIPFHPLSSLSSLLFPLFIFQSRAHKNRQLE